MKRAIQRWALRIGRKLLWRADEWVHAQEVRLREPRADVASITASPGYDRRASGMRERAIVTARRKQKTPKLRYVAGEFVRTDMA